MKLLVEDPLPVDVAVDRARIVTGSTPTDVFYGDSLDVPTARAIAESIQLPGGEAGRVVVCVFDEVSARAADVLLMAVEENDSSVLFSCSSSLPETFRSRFTVQRGRVPSVQELYEGFSVLGATFDLDTLCQMYPELPRQRVTEWHERYMQALGTVGQYLASVVDGNHEAALRSALLFDDNDLELLYVDVEAQLVGLSVTNVSLSRISRDKLLEVAALAEIPRGASPGTQAALVASILI